MLSDRDPFEKMKLSFEEENKEKTTTAEIIMESITNVTHVEEENSSEVRLNEANVNSTLDNSITFVEHEEETKEKKKAKKVKKEKKKTKGSLAKWDLVKSISWMFVVALAIGFGVATILEFADSLETFIKVVQDETATTASQISKFWPVFFRIWEAGLFVFFILYGIKMSIKTMIPFLKWRKETAPERAKAKLASATKKEDDTKAVAITLGIKYKEVIYDEDMEPEKELNLRIKNTKKLQKKINKVKSEAREKKKVLKNNQTKKEAKDISDKVE